MSRRLLFGTLFAAGLAVFAGRQAAGDDPPDDLPIPIPAGAVPGLPGAAAPMEVADPDNPDRKYPDFKQLTKGAKSQDGLIPLHLKEDHLYAEFRPDQFDKPFLLPIAVARGAGMGGSTLNFDEQWVVVFKKVADRVFLIRRNVRVKANAGTPEAKAVETTYHDSVLMAIPIRTINQMKGTTVIDLADVFFSDFAELGLGYPDRSRTTWGKVKSFKKNVEVQVAATFAGGGYGRGFFFGGGADVIDNRGVTIVIQYGLIELPEGGYTPRLADDRVGYFLSAVKDFSGSSPDTSYVRHVNRWRLERADGTPWKEGGKLSPPKKRIVFWIENSVPEEYREAVREGILEWNKAFEKVGFKNAIEVRQQEGEEFDPEDVTYATFRWITSDIPYAIGPSRANPLTGEILDADILFDASMVRYFQQESRVFRDDKGQLIAPASIIQATRRGWELPVHPLAMRGNPAGWNTKAAGGKVTPEARLWQRLTAAQAGYCRCASHKRAEMAFAVLHLAAQAGVKDGEKLPDELLQQAVKEVTMHEVGHTLGLRHNFKASSMVPNDKLHDKEFTKNGLVGSVMDYTPANIAPVGAKQGYYFTPTIGPYDYWAIEYAYKPIAGDEAEELKKIAEKVADPKLTYATDEDLYGTPDPLVNVWDLGADPMQFGKDRIKLAQDLMATLADKAVEKGEGYQRLRTAFTLMLYQYGDAAYLAAKHVGGLHVHRDHKGDPNGRDPIVPVAAAKQRQALVFLRDNVLTDKPFNFPPELLRKLAAERWMHWGYEMVFFQGVEYPLNERILSIQKIALDELLSGGTLSRIQNAARSAGKDEKPLTLSEVFRTLSDAIFADLGGAEKAGAAKSSVLTRNLQRAYLARLAEMVVGPKPDDFGGYFIIIGPSGGGEVPADAKSLARLHLKEIKAKLDAALQAEKDDTVKAHLDEARERIGKVLSATVTANEP
jgi:hypothetical protein